MSFANAQRFANWTGHLRWQDRAQATSQWVKERFPALADVVQTHPFDKFELVSNSRKSTNYLQVPADLLAFLGDIPLRLQAPYLCALLLWHMDRFAGRFAASGLDPEFASHYGDCFNRIVDQIRDNPEFARVDRDAYLKDLWIARVVMIPAIAQVWWPRSGVPFRQLAYGGARALAHAYLRCGGRKPFLEAHTHTAMVAQGFWNAAGWREALRLGALALGAFPQHKGVFSTAWYFDPTATEISPHLGFVTALQLHAGAHRFFVGSNEAAIANATAKSRTRRQLHVEGRYTPTNYCIVWSRRDLLAAYGASLEADDRSMGRCETNGLADPKAGVQAMS